MCSTKNTCINRTLPLCHRVTKWMYVWMLLGCCAQFPRNTACSWFDRARQRFLSRVRGSVEYSTLQEDSSLEGYVAPRDRHPRERYPEADPALAEVYSRLLSLRDRFVSVQSASASQKRLYVEAVNCGLDVVAPLVSLTVRRLQAQCRTQQKSSTGKTSSHYHGIVRHGQSVKLVSAATGETGQYTFTRGFPNWSLVGPEGQRYYFRLWPLHRDPIVRKLYAFRAPELVEATLRLTTTFDVQSLQDVERFGLPVMNDILTHPSGQPHLPFPVGSALNFIIVWKPTVVRLWSLARTIQDHSTLYPEDAEIARHNLTLQLMQLIGRITLRGVVLDRFSVSEFRLDKSGQLLFAPHHSPRRVKRQGSLVSEGATTAGSGTSWPGYDQHTNAKDMVRALLYLWCPLESRGVSIYYLSPTKEAVLTVAAQCTSMPDDARQIVHSVFEGDTDVGQLLFSDVLIRLHHRLRQLVQERSTIAQR